MFSHISQTAALRKINRWLFWRAFMTTCHCEHIQFSYLCFFEESKQSPGILLEGSICILLKKVILNLSLSIRLTNTHCDFKLCEAQCEAQERLCSIFPFVNIWTFEGQSYLQLCLSLFAHSEKLSAWTIFYMCIKIHINKSVISNWITAYSLHLN
jgi:hypothetical protein